MNLQLCGIPSTVRARTHSCWQKSIGGGHEENGDLARWKWTATETLVSDLNACIVFRGLTSLCDCNLACSYEPGVKY